MSMAKLFMKEFFDRSFKSTSDFFDDIYEAELFPAFEKYLPRESGLLNGESDKLILELSASLDDRSTEMLKKYVSSVSKAIEKEKRTAFKCGIKAGMRFVHELAERKRIKEKLLNTKPRCY